MLRLGRCAGLSISSGTGGKRVYYKAWNVYFPPGRWNSLSTSTVTNVSDSKVFGVKSRPVIIADTKHHDTTDCVLGIHFKPGGAFPFLPFPLHDLHNLDISIDDLWGKMKACQLLGLLHEADTIHIKFKVLEQWLLMNLHTSLHHHPAVLLAASELKFVSGVSIKKLATAVNLSHKRFIQMFQNEIGLTPKLYARIMRFQKVLDNIETLNGSVWSEVADVCGYFDQSHLIHEFQEFSGITPTAYMDIRTEHRNHLPLHH